MQGSGIKFAKDVLFKSASAAAAMVCGGNRNGREVWKDRTGKSLKELEEELAGAPVGETTELG